LRSLAPGRWVSDGGVRGSGAMWARGGESGGVSLYFRYKHEGRAKSLALGPYDESGAKGLTLGEARDRAKAHSKLYQAGVSDLHGHLQREREAAERERKAAEEATQRAKEESQRGTLRQLLTAYADHLQRQGKQSARDVRSIFDKHVLAAAPDLARRKAASLGVDDFVDVISRLVEARKGRTADKLRSYLRASYQLAVESKTNPAAPMALRSFGVSINPIASIGALSQFNRARDRVLDASELGAFLRRVDALRPGAQKDALQLLLLLGGQRPMQLLHMKATDVDLSAGTVTLYDGKGARSQPRKHVLPLVKEAAAILERRLEQQTAAKEKSEGDVPLFSTDDRTSMRHETVSALVADIAAELVKEGEARESFQARDLRRTAETMLASLKVSSDVRAQLQSHGLGGVQQRHYDKHTYSLEKRQALEKWQKHLASLKADEKKAKVTDIASKRRKRTAREDARAD
jgi:integrase